MARVFLYFSYNPAVLRNINQMLGDLAWQFEGQATSAGGLEPLLVPNACKQGRRFIPSRSRQQVPEPVNY